jgi:hypothetical protein
MFIFLDESGDLGFDFYSKSPSRYFVITVLVADDYTPFAHAVERTLKNKLRKRKNGALPNELKGSDTRLAIKQYFYQQLQKYEQWYINAIVLDKHALWDDPNLLNDVHRLYNLLSRDVLMGINMTPYDAQVHLYIDRSKDASEINRFDTYIRSHLESWVAPSTLLNIEHVRSQTNAGLQAVDMFCYGIARKFERQDLSWYDCFQHHIRREILFRP